jgi:hypothetical protein
VTKENESLNEGSAWVLTVSKFQSFEFYYCAASGTFWNFFGKSIVPLRLNENT